MFSVLCSVRRVAVDAWIPNFRIILTVKILVNDLVCLLWAIGARLSSWFGIPCSVLKWFKSYLSPRSFRIKCNDCFSSPHTCLCGVNRGSVLGSLLFIMYTTPLRTLPLSHLSPWTRPYHLYADDTQLFFSFYPQDLDLSIARLQNAIYHISYWMTANFNS